MRLTLLAVLALIGFMQAVPALAQDRRGDLEAKVRHLEDKVYSQDAAINDLYERLDRMDRRGRGPGPGRRPPERAGIVNCLVVDAGYKKTFLGSGSTQIDAEYNARQACQKEVSPSYCATTVKCDSTSDNPRSSGAVCVVTDAGYKKTFRGDGSTPVEAEALAKQSCQSDVSPSYCGGQTPRCELKQ